jgi:hypothetical protein
MVFQLRSYSISDQISKKAPGRWRGVQRGVQGEKKEEVCTVIGRAGDYMPCTLRVRRDEAAVSSNQTRPPDLT